MQKNSKIYNIGNNAPLPLITFIETVENDLGKKAEKNFYALCKMVMWSQPMQMYVGLWMTLGINLILSSHEGLVSLLSGIENFMERTDK